MNLSENVKPLLFLDGNVTTVVMVIDLLSAKKTKNNINYLAGDFIEIARTMGKKVELKQSLEACQLVLIVSSHCPRCNETSNFLDIRCISCGYSFDVLN